MTDKTDLVHIKDNGKVNWILKTPITLTVHTMPLSIQDPSAMMQTGLNNSPTIAMDGNGAASKVEEVVCNSKKLQDDLKMVGLKIKRHEDNIKFIKDQENILEGSIIDAQVALGKYHSSNVVKTENDDVSGVQSEVETVETIQRHHEKSAAAIICQVKTRHGAQASHLPWTVDILGVVATLGKVNDENHSRLLSEYLGMERMLAVVCKTYNAVKSIEMYEKDGSIDKSSGLHGLGASIGRALDGRFLIICLETLRPYYGAFVADDPQRRLDLVKPRLPSGELPPGFLGFAVNMIQVDPVNLYYVTANGDGLRETLFYNLFSRLQVYGTKGEMMQALPLIREGAVSLDGGIIRGNGIISLGSRNAVDVKFPKCCGSIPDKYYESEEDVLKEMKWKKERLMDDKKREQTLLDQAKLSYKIKKHEFRQFLAQNNSYISQVQVGRAPTPR